MRPISAGSWRTTVTGTGSMSASSKSPGRCAKPTPNGWRSAAPKITDYARHLGWRTLFHHTNQPPRTALLWLYMALGERA